MAHNQDKQESIVKAILISIECRWHLRTKRLVCPIISSSRYAWFPPQSNAREWQRKSEFQLKSNSSQIANIAKGLGFSLKARASNNISKNALARFWLWYPNKSQTQNHPNLPGLRRTHAAMVHALLVSKDIACCPAASEELPRACRVSGTSLHEGAIRG